MIDRLITFGEGLGVVRGAALWHAETAALGTGGAEANVAMAAARSGASAHWLGRVGDDAFGRRVARELRAEGVTVDAIVDPVAPTGLLVKEQHPGGRTSVSYHRRDSAGSRLSPADIERLPLGASSLLHVTGITPALSASACAATIAALERAAAAGAPVSVDVNHRSRLWRAAEAAAIYRDLAARADILFAGLDEVPLLVPGWGGGDAEDAARSLASAGHQQVIVTAGAAGAVALVDGQVHHVDAVPVEVVDTVGAGDAFVGGYLAGVIAGHDIASRLRRAAILGAAACRHPGDWEGVADLRGLDGTTEDPVAR